MPTSSPTRPQRLTLTLLISAFVLSGCAALIYEVVWFQMLELLIGSSAISLGILLGVFMGGMCAGSLLAPKVLTRSSLSQSHPLRVYSCIELSIGILSVLLLLVIPLAGSLYVAWSPPGAAGLMVRGLITGICLLPPAMLVGATLPVVARLLEAAQASEASLHSTAAERSAAWLGLFYGGNILGAVAGSLLAAFVLLRFFDVATATLAAAALNATAAALSWAVSRAESGAPAEPIRNIPDGLPLHGIGRAAIYISVALSGFTALACEVIWTRQLALFSGATVFAFALILAVFLAGLGIGAIWGATWARRTQQAQWALAICQTLLTTAIAWAAYQLALVLPFWSIDPARMADPWRKLQLDLLRTAWAVLPATVLWGASFPLAVAAILRKGERTARATATAYGANTLGAIAGALAAGLWMIPHLGSGGAQSG